MRHQVFILIYFFFHTLQAVHLTIVPTAPILITVFFDDEEKVSSFVSPRRPFIIDVPDKSITKIRWRSLNGTEYEQSFYSLFKSGVFVIHIYEHTLIIYPGKGSLICN